jgi:branched-chain amino acid transport system ATP-binding protein
MTATGTASQQVILRTRGVGKLFGKFVALRNITAEFTRGAITSIIGPNGAGKSTYFNLLSGALSPSSGSVEFEGRDVTGLPQHRFAHMGVAKSFQITNVFPQLTTRENIRVGLQALVSRYDMWRPRARLVELTEQADELLARVGLWEQRERAAAVAAGRADRRDEPGRNPYHDGPDREAGG